MLFISHAHEDHEVAANLCGELERRGVPCWIAPRDVTPGCNYADEIMRGIDSCDAMALVMSDHANESSMVGREIERAVAKNKRVIPIRTGASAPRGPLEFLLAGQHWIDGGRDVTQCAAAIVRALKKPEPPTDPQATRTITARPERETPHDGEPSVDTLPGSRRSWLPWVVSFGAAVVIAAWWFQPPRLPECLAGEWREQYEDPLHWVFTVEGNTLEIRRTDGFASGTFTKMGDHYEGSVRFGNGEEWTDIEMTPSADCTRVATNRSWQYRR